jgi:hypothetical protein
MLGNGENQTPRILWSRRTAGLPRLALPGLVTRLTGFWDGVESPLSLTGPGVVSVSLHIFSTHAKKCGLELLPEAAEIADSNFTCELPSPLHSQNM